MSYVLGIDGGGSKTVCVLMDDLCQVLGRGESGPSNYQSIGIEATLQSIKSAIKNAIEAAIITNTVKIDAICLGLAGVDRAADIEVVKGLVKELHNNKSLPINWALQPANIVICNDALIALVGGIGQPVGIVVAAGTGSIIFGRNHQGDIKRVGGWGYILGDEGSAYKIAIAGMNAALKSYDGREMPTSLIEGFKQHLDLESIEDLIEVIYRRGWGVKKIAALAPIVDLAAASGDELANNIIDDAVKDLVKATSIVIDAIFNADSVLEVVTTGSVWRGRCKIHDRFAEAIVKKFPKVKVIFPRYEPAYGAGLLALQTTQN
jgi:N-acetylglucosamine kinase-like BadF-type ATPase